LLELARTGGPEQIRRALTRLAEARSGPDADQGSELTDPELHDPELADLVGELLTHPRPKVRLHAHRTSRVMLDRQTHLDHTSILLNDPQPELVRTAIWTFCHPTWKPAIPAVAGLLEHSHPLVRKAAAKGLVGMGPAAIPALRHAADHARPDRRHLYTEILEQIMTDDEPGPLLRRP
jgi:hypothetical protein